MTRRLNRSSLLVLMMMPFLAPHADASLIAYNAGTGNRNDVMVMEDTGANPVVIYGGGKFSGGGNLTISPAGPGGTWVAFIAFHYELDEMGALYKARTDDTGPIKVLCSMGTYIDGTPYYLADDMQWSPDGNEILVQTYDVDYDEAEFGLLPATFAVGSGAEGSDCESPLVHIYPFDEWAEDGWSVMGGPAWNGDGSRIAFFEEDQDGGIRLVILERKETGWEPTVVPTDLDRAGHGLDWQREGNLLAFATRMGVDPQGPVWLKWVDAGSGDWGYLTEGGSPLEGSHPSWSPDDSRLIFTDRRGDLVKWTSPDGPTEVLGRGTWPDWQRDPLACASDLDCDDGRPCTDDTCDLGTGLCTNPPNFNTCDDGNECTLSDTCDASGLCFGLPASDGDPCFGGGSCCGAQCVVPACTVALDCDDGNFCTLDACSNWLDPCAASCQYTTNPDPICQCLPKRASCSSDTECCSNKCRGGRCR